jgi:hypothetical protein
MPAELKPEVAAKYKVVNCPTNRTVLRYGRTVYWPDVTLAEADKYYANGEATHLLQLKEQPTEEKVKKKKSSKEGE